MFQKRVCKITEEAVPIARKKDLIIMYRDVLVSGFVNILLST